MNHEKIPDPTADRAIYNVDKQKRLEKLHDVVVGEEIILYQSRNENGGLSTRRKVRKKNIKVRIIGLYDDYVRCLLPWGYAESYTWWAFDRMRSGMIEEDD